jgi:hypothetical protein
MPRWLTLVLSYYGWPQIEVIGSRHTDLNPLCQIRGLPKLVT